MGKSGRRFVAILLSVMMVASQMGITAYAVDNVKADDSVKAASEQAAEQKDAPKSEATDISSEKTEKETVATEETAAEPEGNMEAAAPDPGEAVTAEPQGSDADQPAEVSFSQTATVDGVKIKVTADKGVFPEGAKLVAKAAGSSDAKAADKAIGEEEQADASYAFDISVVDKDGNKIQPDNAKGETKISFTAKEVADRSLETSVYHIEGKTAEELNAKESGSTATVLTESFSVFVLKFYTGDDNDVAATYTIETGKKIYLDDLLREVGLGSSVGAVNYAKTDRHGDKRLTINTDNSDPSISAYWYVIADGVWKDNDTAVLTFYNGSDQELFSINIKCAQVAVTAPVPKDLVFNGDEQKLAEPGSVKGGNMKYHCTAVDADAPTSGWGNDVPTGKDADTYWVWYTAVDDAGNDIAEPAHVTATIAKKACEVTLDPVGLTLNYTGNSQNLVTAGKTDVGIIYYSLNGKDFTNAIPKGTEPGEYTIQYKASIEGNDNYKDSKTKTVKAYIKDPGAVSITLPEAKAGLVYSGDPQALVTSGSVDSGFDIYFTLNGTNWDTAVPARADAATYTVRYRVFKYGGDPIDYSQYKFVDAADGKTEVAPYGTLSIKIASQTITVTPPSAKTDLVYTGEAQELINDGKTPAAFDFHYAVTGATQTTAPDPTDYSAAIPALKDIGTYKVWYQLGKNDPTVNLDNFNFVDNDGNAVEINGAMPVSIAKDTPYIYEFPEKIKGLVYNGGDQELVTAGSVRTVSGHNYVWRYSFEPYKEFNLAIPAKTDVGEYTVYCRVMDGTNFVSTEPELALKVKIVKPTITPPVGAELTYNGKAQRLIGYEATTNSGQISYTLNPADGWKEDPAEITGENAGSYTVSWKVEGANSKVLASGTVTATIAKGQAVSTKDPEVIEGLVYNGKDQTLLTKGTATNGVWQYRITSINGTPQATSFANDLPKGKAAGTYTIECKVEPISSNYEGSEVIEKTAVIAAPTITAPVAAELVYNGQNQILIGYEGKTNSGTFYYKKEGGQWETSPAKITGMGVGSYPIEWSAQLENEVLASGTITATIAAGQSLAVKEPKKVTGLVYNDQPQTLLSDGTAAFGQWVYRIISINGEPQTEDFARDLPTGTKAGIYTIECKVKGDTGYKDTDPIIKNVAIDELEVTAPAGVGLIYNGKPQELLETAATTNSTDRNVKVYYRIKKDPLPEASADIPKEIGDAEKTTDYTIQYWAARSSNPTHDISAIGEVTSVISWINFKQPVTLNAVYNGEDQELVVTPASVKDGAEGVIQYCLTNSSEDDDWTTDYASLKGKEAKEYNVYYRIIDPETIDQKVIYGPYVAKAAITEANPLKSAPEAVTVDYNGEPQALATEGALTKLAKNDGLKIEFTCSADGTTWSDWSEDVPEATNAGSYYVQYRVNENGADKNFSKVPRITLISNIGKIDPQTTAPSANELVYNAAPQELLTAGTSESANWEYKVRTYPADETPAPSDKFSETVPKATAAGTYVVRCRVPKTENYNAAGPIDIEVTIDRPTIKAPVGAETVYNGKEQVLVGYPGSTNVGIMQYSGDDGNTWTKEASEIKGTDAKTYDLYWRVINEDTKATIQNYTKFNATITQAAASGTAPEAKTGLIYNGKAQGLLTAGTSKEGAWKYRVVGEEDNYSYDVPARTEAGTYTIESYIEADTSGNYKNSDVTTTEVTIAPLEFVKDPQPAGLVFNGQDQALLSKLAATNSKDEDVKVCYQVREGGTETFESPKAKGDAAEDTRFTIDYWAVNTSLAPDSQRITAKNSVTATIKAITVTPPTVGELVYNTREQALLSRPATTNSSDPNVKVVYRIDGTDEEITTIPRAAGDPNIDTEYKVLYAVKNMDTGEYLTAADSVTATIRTIKVDRPKALDGTYNGRAQRLITDYDDPEAGMFQFSLDQKDWSRNIPTKTDADTYYVYWRVVNRSGDLLYGPYYETAKIAKAAAVSLRDPAAVEGLVYDGEAHELIEPGATRDGEWQYRLISGPENNSNDTFAAEIPKGTVAGDYVVECYIKGDANHKDGAVIKLTVTIGKAEPSADIETVRGLVYDGKEHALVTIESRTPEDAPIQFSLDGKTFQDEIPTEVEPGTYDIYYRILETDNYKASEVLGPIVVTIDRIEVRVNRPDAIDSVYNGAPQVLVEPGRARATNSDRVYELFYKMSDEPDQEYREFVAEDFSATNVGEYTVDFKVVAKDGKDIDRNHVKLVDRAGRRVDNPDSVTATISELTLSDAEGITINYDSNKHALISTPAVTNSTDEDVVVVYYLLTGKDEYAKVEEAEAIGDPSTIIPEQIGQAGKTSHYIIKYWAANSSNIGVPISEQKFVRSTIKWLNLEAPEPVTTVYNGHAQKLLVKPGSAVRGTVKYCLGTYEYEEDKWTDNINDITATDPGTYKIYYRVYENGQILQGKDGAEGEKYVEAVIYKGQVNVIVEPRGINGIVYDGEDHVLLRAGAVRHGTWQYGFVPADGNLQQVKYSDELPVGNKAGTYTIACYVKGDENYANYLDNDPMIIKVRIAKAEPSAVVEAIEGLSYIEGESQPLVRILSRTPEDAGVWFSEDGYNFSGDIPEGTNAGKYKIYYKVTGEGNYGESKVFELEAKISKVKLSVAVKPKAAGNPIPYTDTKQKLVTEGVSAPADISKMVYSIDGEEFFEEIPEAKDAGKYTVYYKAVAKNDETAKNYAESETGSVDVKIKKPDFVMTAPTGKSLTYNGKAQELVNEGSVPEGYRLQYVYNTYDADSSPVGKDAGKYKVKYYVAAGDTPVNMNLFNVIDAEGNPVDATGTVITTIDKAQPTVTVKGVNSVYDGTYKTLVDVTKIPEDTVLKYKIKKDGELLGEFSDPRMKDAGVYEVEWKIVGDENHEGDFYYHDSVTAVVSKTVLRVKAPQAIPGLVYNGSSQQLMSAGSLVGDVADQASLKYAVTLASVDEPTASQFYYSGKEMTDAGKYYIWYDVFTADGKAKLDKKNIDVVDFYTGDLLTDSLPGRVEGKISKQGIDVVWGETTHVYDAHPWAPVGVATPAQKDAENLELTEKGFETDTNAKTGRDYTATVALANKADRQNYFLTEDTASTSFKIEQRKVRLAWQPDEFTYDGKAHLPFAAVWDSDVCTEDKDRQILGESYSVEGEKTIRGNAILPGYYKVYVNELRDKNYVPNDKSSTYEGQFEIKKGSYDGPDGTLAVYLEGWIYKEDPNVPQVTGLPEMGMRVSYFYKGSDEGEDAWKPYDTRRGQYPTEAGTYDIKAVVAETATYNEATATNIFTISPAAAGLEAPTAIDREYDGTTQDLVTAGSIEGGAMKYLVSDTKPSPDDAFKDEIPTAKNAGTYKVWYKYDVVNPDYEEVHGIGGPVNVTISTKPVSITWDKLRLTYNSKAQKPTAEMLKADGLVNGDTVKVDVSTGDIEAIDVGRYKAYAALSGESAPNYEIIADYETKKFEITPADLTVVWGEKQFVYDGKPHVPEVVQIDGVYEGDNVSAYSTGEKVKVGTYTATAHITGQDADNYTISKPRIEFTISAEEIASIKWENLEFTYDGEPHKPTAKLIGTDGKEITGVTAVVAGTKVEAGTYEAKVIGIEGDDADNYKLPADCTTDFTINKRVVELVWTKTETTYNGDIQKPEVSVGNKVSGDDVRVSIDTSGYTNAGEYKYDDISKLSLSGRDKANYELPKAIDQTFVIKKADAVLDWTDLEFVYDGKEHKPTATITNLIGDDKCQVVVKPGAVEAGTHWTAAYIEGNDNYQLSEEMSAKQFLINQREAVIEWNDLNPVYNGTDQVPTAKIANAVEGDEAEVKVIAVDADGNPLAEGEYTEAGNYIAKALIPEGGNYVLPEDCTTSYSIVKAELTVTANDNTINYGQAPAGNGVSYSGFLPGDTSAVVKGDVTYSFNYQKNGKPGSYSITPAGLSAENYSMKYVSGTLVVKDIKRILVSKGTADGSTKIKVQWTSVDGAASYDIYMSKCNTSKKKYTPKKIRTVGKDYTSYIKSGLKKKQCYKFYVVAKDSKGKVIAKSTTSHCITGGYDKANTNAKSITLNKSKVTIARGATVKVSVTQKKVKSGKKLLNNLHAPLVRYISTNTEVATVNGSGVIHAEGTGYCRVYVQAVDGIWKYVEVNVK